MISVSQRHTDQSFSGARWASFSAVSSHFYRCDFSGATIGNACWGSGSTKSTYIECLFDGATLRSVTPGVARFERCSFLDVLIKEFYAFDIDMIDCTFSGELRKGFLNGQSTVSRPFRPAKPNIIRGNSFREARLLDFCFRTGVDLSLQELPRGEDYVLIENTGQALAKVRSRASALSSSAVEKDLQALASLLEFDIAGGQKQQLYRPSSLGLHAIPPTFWRELASQ
jgi:hypothetical protein